MSYFERRTPSWLPLLILVFPIIPLFYSYTVSIDEEALVFGYSHSWTRQTLSRSSVASARTRDVSPLGEWGGWGIRTEFSRPEGESSRATGYIASGGDAVEIKTHDGRRFCFSCADPSRALAALGM